MSELSLQKSIRTCKVDTGNADRLDSDRFLNANNTLCPVWTGRDLTGRQVCSDSFYTKSAGCNTPNDRIIVENDVVRPKYFEYIPLNAVGVTGNIYGTTKEPTPGTISSQAMTTESIRLQQMQQSLPNFGVGMEAQVRNYSCSINPYEAQVAASRRRIDTATLSSYFNQPYKMQSGM